MNRYESWRAPALLLGIGLLAAGCTTPEITSTGDAPAASGVSTKATAPAQEPASEVVVPDVTGKDAAAATATLVAAGFKVGTVGSGTVVTGTTPGAGATVAAGSKVSLILAAPKPDGTRENPFAAGATLSGSTAGVDEATLTIGQATWDADAAVAAENQFNDPAGAGNSYVLVPLTITNVASEDAVTPWLAFRVKYVAADGRSFDEASAVIPQELDDVGDLYKGGVGTGNIAFVIPKDAQKSGLWAVTYGWSSDEVFVEAT